MTFSGCAGSDVIMTVTTLGVVAMYGLVFLRSRKDASVLTSAIASLYCLYLQWTALSSDINTECNPNLSNHGTVIWQIVLGMVFTVISLFTISASTKSGEETSVAAEAGGHLLEKKEDLEARPEEGPTDKEGKTAEEAHTFEISSATIIF